MKRIAVPLALLLGLTSLLSCASPAPPSPTPPQQAATAKPNLDDLFMRLRTTASTEEAHGIELEIMHVWSSSGRPEVDALLAQGTQLAHDGELDAAVQTLDQVVAQAPDFAEGYNQRAAVHVMREEYAEAILDIQKTLALEPRHFAALAGLGRILLLFDRETAALLCFEAALAVNPHLDSVREQAEEIKEQLAGIEV